MNEQDAARQLVEQVREAAARHRSTWEALIPSTFIVNFDAEGAEEEAYQDMAAAKRALRDHICDMYGITFKELASLAAP